MARARFNRSAKKGRAGSILGGILAAGFTALSLAPQFQDKAPVYDRKFDNLMPERSAAVVFSGGPERLRAGMLLYMRGDVDYLVISGVHASLTPEKLFNRMRLVPGRSLKNVILDHKAKNTAENAAQSGRILRELPGVTNVILVTDSDHMDRAETNMKRSLPETTHIYRRPVRGKSGAYGFSEYYKNGATILGISNLGPGRQF